MATANGNNARLNFRLPAHLKELIERAAAQTGQTVSDFAVSTLSANARAVLQQQEITELSNRDRDLFLAMLDNTASKPNKALIAAAKRYRKVFGV
jgi:uncharacterized protein (DUF1778 family)